MPSEGAAQILVEFNAWGPRRELAANMVVSALFFAGLWAAATSLIYAWVSRTSRELLLFFARFPATSLLGSIGAIAILSDVWPPKVLIDYSPRVVAMYASITSYESFTLYLLLFLSGLYAVLFYAYAIERKLFDALELASFRRSEVVRTHLVSWVLLYWLLVIFTVLTLSYSYAAILYQLRPIEALSIVMPVVLLELTFYLLVGYLVATLLCMVFGRVNVAILAHLLASFGIVELVRNHPRIFEVYWSLADLDIPVFGIPLFDKSVEEVTVGEVLSKMQERLNIIMSSMLVERLIPKTVMVSATLLILVAILYVVAMRREFR
ncbi:hypothetical protein Pyrfu_1017 [Pyrolobus fumarii 1A]|uniref:Uncharacterized protein n=1 Tax=Pyrolobus fumarii (strain DSM 11204 / 1A) TaxID=694429 RepID=G0EER3_PYRF1|nr:hypothetical protein [Pyrolobus fumarii]AEM38885.1 hypothetical protein Pyrfu_1017 [Pyrolobus fumarii 1A]